jgi:hypothetical protein
MSVSDRSHRIPWLQIGVETFFVVLGVLLALAVDEWRENRRDQAVVSLALQNLREEIRANRPEVQRALAHHRDQQRRLEETPGIGVALKPALVRNNAWQAAQTSQAAAHMDFSSVAACSKLEELQGNYQSLLAGVMPSLYRLEDRPSMPLVLQDLIWFEEKLLQAYDETERAIPAG